MVLLLLPRRIIPGSLGMRKPRKDEAEAAVPTAAAAAAVGGDPGAGCAAGGEEEEEAEARGECVELGWERGLASDVGRADNGGFVEFDCPGRLVAVTGGEL